MTSGGRYVLLGLARARCPWFAEVSQWATSGALAGEFVKAVSMEEATARLRSGRRFSALLVDAAVPGWGRDTVELAAAQGCAVIVVEREVRDRADVRASVDPETEQRWDDLGVDAVLPAGFDRTWLVDVLATVARPITRADEAGMLDPALAIAPPGQADPPAFRGRLVAVTGAGGTGRSTLALALAAGLAADPRDRGLVLLADLALNAQQGLLHDAGDVVPGLVELVEAHRRSRLDAPAVRRLCFEVEDRGYDLLLGLRRHRDWTALQPRSTAAALEALRSTYRLIVADVDPDVEGEADTGLLDIEDRNQLARITLEQADLVLVVGRAGLSGLHSQIRVLSDLIGFGLAPGRVLPVVNLASRSRRRRAECVTALHRLTTDALPGTELAATPLFVPERRRLDDVIYDGGRLPSSVGGLVTGAVRALLDRVPTLDAHGSPSKAVWRGSEPVAVAPGSVGSWTELTGEHA